MGKTKRKFKKGDTVEFFQRTTATVTGFRWVGFSDGSGIWKYRLSDGSERVTSSLALEEVKHDKG